MTWTNTLLFVVLSIAPSLLITWAAAWIVRRLAPRMGLIDRPDARKAHASPTSLGGGLAIAAGTVVTLAVGQLLLLLITSGRVETLADLVPEFAQPHLSGLWERSASLWLMMGCAAVLLLTGLVDDVRGLDWRVRLAVQTAVAVCVVLRPDWRMTLFVEQPLLTGAVSVLWIVGLVNAFNMLDNMDGLSAGVAAIAAALLAMVLLMSNDPETGSPQLFVTGLLLVLVGSLLGFLWHNRPPARLFMGDAGSYFVGFCIAVATLQATFTGYHSEARYTILAPLCVMAVPLYDMITVILIRLREGRSPFTADRCHLSHRLVALGFTKSQAVLTIYLLTVTCGLGALLLHRVDSVGAVVVVLLVLCVLALVAVLETTARAAIDRANGK